MATILSQEQCNRIKAIREEINAIPGIEGWMSEGADDRCNTFFNNDTDGYFLADDQGNIVLSKNVRITQELRKLAWLEGQIRLIAEEEPKSHSEVGEKRMTLRELLGFYDFDYMRHPDGYGLVDCTGANLGNIEAERFEDPIDMVGRIFDGPYGNDYLLEPDEGDEEMQEMIRLHGDDKDWEGGFLYYSLHPEELDELPPVLKEEDLTLE